MRRLPLLALMLAVLALAPQRAYAQLDTALTAALESHLEEYFSALDREPMDVKLAECDFMLESCEDSLTRQYVAVRIYDHFLGSNIMGDETVAVHMVDDWFVPGKVSMYDEIDMLNARVYADFHRNSLVGKQAPVLKLQEADGTKVTLPREGDISVLFFYDTSCAKCKVETLLLRSVLAEVTAPIQFYAVYTGVHKEQWEEFIKARWDYDAPQVTVHHLWDPELESDFQRQYGVLQTPQMLLVDQAGTIVGRGLDTQALEVLLARMLPQPYEYGAAESKDLFKLVFEDDNPTASRLLETAEYIKVSTLAQRDSTLCRHMLGDYMYYLMDTPGEEYKIALQAFIATYIEGDAPMWRFAEDRSRVVQPARIAADLLGRTPVGSTMPQLKVFGTLSRQGRSRSARVRLDRVKGSPSYILFYDPECSSCAAERARIQDVLGREPGARVLEVDPAQDRERLLDTFDLSTLPLIIQTDKKGRIQRRYISWL